MKLNKFLMGILGVLALTACSSEENIPNSPDENENRDPRFISVSIRNFNPGTRAAGDQQGDLYEEGLTGENAVKNIRFYFFGENGAPFNITLGNNPVNYYTCTDVEEDNNAPGMPNVEKKLKAIIILNAAEIDFGGLKSMVAVVNYDNAGLTENKSTSLAELREITRDYGIYRSFNNKSQDIPNMLMTSSVYGTEDKYMGCEVLISGSKLKTSEADAVSDPVDVYVERVLAKVRVTTKWDQSVVTKKMTYGGVEYNAVALKDKKTNEQYETTDGKKIYAVMLGWGLQTYTDDSYLFKSLGEGMDVWNASLADWAWNDAPNRRSYWALNSPAAKHINVVHSAATAKIGSVLTSTNQDGSTTTISYDGDFLYTQENAADNTNGLKEKSAYSPATEVSPRTQAYIRAVLVDENGNEISLAEWGGQKYTENDVVTAMFSSVQNQIFMRKEISRTNDGDKVTINYEYKAIPQSMVHLVRAEVVGKANKESENSKRYLSYITLKERYEDYFEEGFEHTFVDAEHKDLTPEQVVDILLGMPGAKVWRNGATYFYTDLSHLNTADNTGTKGGYGVVRNHIYEVELNTIFGLGTPVLTPEGGDGKDEDPIVPQKPSPDAYFLGARLNILSWRVVNNTTNFEW